MKTRSLPARDDGDVTFLLAEPDDLELVVTAPQALDNQWIPRGLLAKMMRPDRPDDAAVEVERLPLVRREYLRSLVTGGQTAINRAYLYNCPAIYQDFAGPRKTEREAFTALLGSRAIVPFLYLEPSPATPPDFRTRDGWDAWLEVIKEVSPTCLRLSWGSDKENETLARRRLSGMLAKFLKTVDELEAPLLAYELGLGTEHVLPLRDRLRDVAEWAQRRSRNDERLHREDFYNEFVLIDGTPSPQRLYDPGKPYAAELKQLIDLRYNANTPDALGSYLLTPQDSLGRRAMQEWGTARSRTTDADQLADLVARLRFDQVTEVLGALAAFDFLTLSDIVRLRSTGAWQRYQRVLRDFLAQPSLDMFDDAEQVVLAYNEVIREAGSIAGARLAEARVERWSPAVELVVEFAGAAVSIFFNVSGGLAFQVTKELAPGVVTRTAKAVISMVIGRVTVARTASQVDNNLRLLEYQLEHGRRDWETFVSALGKLGFRELTDESPGNDQQARIEKSTLDE